MDPRFLDLYEDELKFVREMGVEFARSHPKIAGRLALAEGETPDPYVERLLEGFAFLAARVRLRLDNEFPALAEALLEQVCPNYAAPVPSAAIVAFEPDMSEGALKTGFRLARGAALSGRPDPSSSACEFRLTSDAPLQPIVVDDAEYLNRAADLSAFARFAPQARSMIRLRLRSAGAAPLAASVLDRIPVFVAGDEGVADRALQLLIARRAAVVARRSESGLADVALAEPSVRHLGFADEEALLPQTARGFSGHRLIQEYFMLPAKFRFFEIRGLDAAVAGTDVRAVELFVLCDQEASELAGRLDADAFRLHCAPAVNLFPRKADRVRYAPGASEHHVVVDRTRPRDFEAHSILSVAAVKARDEDRRVFAPLYTAHDVALDADPSAFFTVRRERALAGRRDAGIETYVALSEAGGGPPDPDYQFLVIEALCSNRRLAERLRPGAALALQSAAPVKSARILLGPTPAGPPLSSGGEAWRLVDLLSAGHAGLTSGAEDNGASLRAWLRLFAAKDAPETRRIIEGIERLSSAPIGRRLPGPGPAAFARGLELRLRIDEDAFRGVGAFRLAAVLEEAMARSATLNAVTETVLETEQGEAARWPVRTGRRHVL